MKPFGISQRAIADAIGVTHRHINEIVRGKRGISTGTALHLARAFRMSDSFFSGLQVEYDFLVARDRLQAELTNITVFPAVAAHLAEQRAR